MKEPKLPLNIVFHEVKDYPRLRTDDTGNVWTYGNRDWKWYKLEPYEFCDGRKVVRVQSTMQSYEGWNVVFVEDLVKGP